MTRKVFLNEDSYCQIEILPAENLAHCRKEMDALNDFADENEDPENEYEAGGHPVPFKTLKITPDLLDSHLSKVATPFDIVETGFGKYKEVYPQTKAFGLNDRVVLFYDYEEGIVENIWLMLEIDTQKEQELVQNMLSAIAKIRPFFLVDWTFDAIILLEDEPAIKKYLKELS